MKLTHSNRSVKADFLRVLCEKGMCFESWFGVKYVKTTKLTPPSLFARILHEINPFKQKYKS